MFDRTNLAPRQRLLAALDVHSPLCPFAARLTDAAREAGVTNPEQLSEQLALLLDGASARSRVLNTEALATAAAIAAVLVDNAMPTAAVPFRLWRRGRGSWRGPYP